MFLCFITTFWWAMWKYVTSSRNAKPSLNNLQRNMWLLGFISQLPQLYKRHKLCSKYQNFLHNNNFLFFYTCIICSWVQNFGATSNKCLLKNNSSFISRSFLFNNILSVWEAFVWNWNICACPQGTDFFFQIHVTSYLVF